MTQAGDVFQPTTSAHLQLAPGVDGSRGLTLPQGNLSQFGISRWHFPSLLQEQAVQMEPLLPPLITPACLGQVRALYTAIAPDHSAKCLSAGSLPRSLFSVLLQVKSLSCEALDEGTRLKSKHHSFLSPLFHIQALRT